MLQASVRAKRARKESTLLKWTKLIFFGEPKRERFTAGVGFNHVMLTLLAWRTPWLLSIDIKRKRQHIYVCVPPVVKEKICCAQISHQLTFGVTHWQADVMQTTHALCIFDFMKCVLAHKAKAKILKESAARGKFLVWARACPHYSRRACLHNDWTVHLRRHNPLFNGPVGTVIPDEVVKLDLFKIDKPPKGTLLHR
jgi:hypothetical protein